MLLRKLLFMTFLFVAVACEARPEVELTVTQHTIPTVANTAPTVPIGPTITPIPAPVSSTEFICNEGWESLPVIPEVSEAARTIYQEGVGQGNNPRGFSKIGDGEIATDWFLMPFDLGEEHYDLGEYQHLRSTIETFHGSFERRSVAARGGFNTNLILDASANDAALCHADETPLDCELRIHKPSIAILSLGTNQVFRPQEFQAGMRQIIDTLISIKVLPILSTKGDNLEGDHHINRIIACLAQEYQIPLWNFWLAIQPLPNHGLQPDLEHLTYSGTNDFDDPLAMQSAWAVRNLTALQVLDQVWQSLK